MDYGRTRGAVFVYRASSDWFVRSVTYVALGDFQNSKCVLSCDTLSILGPLSVLVGPLSILEFQGLLIPDFLSYRLGVCALNIDAEMG